MGYIEDTRQVLQDFLAPELRAIVVRLDKLEELVNANERRADERFKQADQRVEQRFSEAEKHADQRFTEAEKHADQRFSDIDRRFSEFERRADQRHSETLNAISTLSNYQAVLERLARLESRQNVSAA